MGARMSLELSDGLDELQHLFDDYQHEPRVLDPEDARAFAACCSELKKRARDLENAVSCKLWNDAARDDRIAEGRRIVAASTNANVILFPLPHRPFSDGRDGTA